MKQPDSIDIGTQMDIAKYCLQTADEFKELYENLLNYSVYKYIYTE